MREFLILLLLAGAFALNVEKRKYSSEYNIDEQQVTKTSCGASSCPSTEAYSDSTEAYSDSTDKPTDNNYANPQEATTDHTEANIETSTGPNYAYADANTAHMEAYTDHTDASDDDTTDHTPFNSHLTGAKKLVRVKRSEAEGSISSMVHKDGSIVDKNDIQEHTDDVDVQQAEASEQYSDNMALEDDSTVQPGSIVQQTGESSTLQKLFQNYQATKQAETAKSRNILKESLLIKHIHNVVGLKGGNSSSGSQEDDSTALKGVQTANVRTYRAYKETEENNIPASDNVNSSDDPFGYPDNDAKPTDLNDNENEEEPSDYKEKNSKEGSTDSSKPAPIDRSDDTNIVSSDEIIEAIDRYDTEFVFAEGEGDREGRIVNRPGQLRNQQGGGAYRISAGSRPYPGQQYGGPSYPGPDYGGYSPSSQINEQHIVHTGVYVDGSDGNVNQDNCGGRGCGKHTEPDNKVEVNVVINNEPQKSGAFEKEDQEESTFGWLQRLAGF